VTQSQMTIQDAYTDWSATYDSDRNLTRDLDQHVARQELVRFSCKSILEVGCGTGKNTPLLASIGERVHALDFSAGMIEKARAKVTSSNVTFEIADITKRWPAKDQSLDLIVCNLVLEHIEDLNFIFAEASRVLVEGGRFFICELHPFRQYLGTQARFQRADDTQHIAAFTHHVTDFTNAALANGLMVKEMREWWHDEDEGKAPRLISFLFENHVPQLNR
jgi:ubiquinone/menaquinone biosynthesis C-methylase UbiE